MLEERFEADTREKRSRRMWFEGLLAIAAFNVCLLLDFLVVKDASWNSIVSRTALITPIALAINELIRRNPPHWVRESSVAAGMFAICLLNLVVEGEATTASTLFGSICLLITALFAGVVMRLRFPYVLATLSAMLVAGLSSLAHSPTLRFSEATMAESMVTVGIAIILVASFSLEFEERNVYLLNLQSDMQAQELAWANRSLRELSELDNLTQLPNRRALDERVAAMWKHCAAQSEPISAVVIDVDHFKLVNDLHGHLYGDEALRTIAALLPGALQSANDMASRFGGEEFVLLLPNTRPDKARAVAERVRRLVESAAIPIDRQGLLTYVPITVSCGVSTCVPGGGLQWNDLVGAADAALYQAKRYGRNRVEFSRCIEPPLVPRTSPETSLEHRVSHISRSLRGLRQGSRARAATAAPREHRSASSRSGTRPLPRP